MFSQTIATLSHNYTEPGDRRMKKIASILTILILLVTACSSPEQEVPQTAGTVIDTDAIFTFAASQFEKAVAQAGGEDYLRFVNDQGVWESTDATAWSSGFFPGCLWLIAEHSDDAVWKERAIQWTAGVTAQKDNRADHNTGYRMLPSFGLGYEFTDDENYRDVLLDAAASLASRFDETVGMIRANDNPRWKCPVLVDTMVSLELLFWAADNGGDPAWKDMAVTHSLNTAKYHIRDDGSAYQVVDFDPSTGEPVGTDVLCGLNAESKWMRGVAEGLTGFALAYKYTGNPELLAAAEKLAAFYMANLPNDYVPFWDVSDPAIPDAIRDASAATMAVVGLYELAESGSPDKRAAYQELFINTITSLTDNYLVDSGASSGIINHATWKKPTDPQADTSIIWGDYTYLLAVSLYASGM